MTSAEQTQRKVRADDSSPSKSPRAHAGHETLGRSRLTNWRRRYLNLRTIVALIALAALLLSTVAEVIGAAM